MKACFKALLAVLVAAVALPLLLLAAATLSYLLPANPEWEEPTEGVDIFLLATPVHVDLVLPVVAEGVDWRQALPHPLLAPVAIESARFVAIGWGDRGFFLNTPRWADLRLQTALNALFWPSESVLHATFLTDLAHIEDLRPLRLSRAQYVRLTDFVRATAAVPEAAGGVVPVLETQYSIRDAFFRANGDYHLFDTCNNWTARALRVAGVRVARWAPFSFGVRVR